MMNTLNQKSRFRKIPLLMFMLITFTPAAMSAGLTILPRAAGATTVQQVNVAAETDAGESAAGNPVLDNAAAGVRAETYSGSLIVNTESSDQTNPTTGTATFTEEERYGGVRFIGEATTATSPVSSTDESSPTLVNYGTVVTAAILTGKVIDPAGLSVANITLKAVKGSQILTSLTDETGNYQFHLTEGVWSVSATDLDYDITPSQKVYEVQGYFISRIE